MSTEAGGPLTLGDCTQVTARLHMRLIVVASPLPCCAVNGGFYGASIPTTARPARLRDKSPWAPSPQRLGHTYKSDRSGFPPSSFAAQYQSYEDFLMRYIRPLLLDCVRLLFLVSLGETYSILTPPSKAAYRRWCSPADHLVLWDTRSHLWHARYVRWAPTHQHSVSIGGLNVWGAEPCKHETESLQSGWLRGFHVGQGCNADEYHKTKDNLDFRSPQSIVEWDWSSSEVDHSSKTGTTCMLVTFTDLDHAILEMPIYRVRRCASSMRMTPPSGSIALIQLCSTPSTAV